MWSYITLSLTFWHLMTFQNSFFLYIIKPCLNISLQFARSEEGKCALIFFSIYCNKFCREWTTPFRNYIVWSYPFHLLSLNYIEDVTSKGVLSRPHLQSVLGFVFFPQISPLNFLKYNSVKNVFHYLHYLKSWKEKKRWDDEVDSYINLHPKELNWILDT